MTEQKVLRRLQHREIQNTHSDAGIILSWDACGLQGEALCYSLPKPISFSVCFTQLRDIEAWRASERHWSQTWPHHCPGGICPGRMAFHSCCSPSAITNLQRTGAAWKFYSAFMRSRPAYQVRRRNREWSGGAQGNTPIPALVKTPGAVSTCWEWRRYFQQVTWTLLGNNPSVLTSG